MASVRFHFHTERPRANGTCTVFIQVAHGGRIRISTETHVLPNEWVGESATNGPTTRPAINGALQLMLANINAEVIRLKSLGRLQQMTRTDLAKHLNSMHSAKPVAENEAPTSPNFAAYYRKHIESKEAGTRGVYENTLSQIGKYADLNTLTFEQIDIYWLRAFEKHMKERKEKPCSTNYIGILLRNIRTVFNAAIDEEVIGAGMYPFRKFKVKKEPTRSRALTIEQLRTLRDYPCEPHQEKYRDLFMLTFYLLGINAVDLFSAKKMSGDRIDYQRTKTRNKIDRLQSIKVEPEAMAIIDKYRGEQYLLDVCDTYGNYKDFLHRMNHNLKQIGEMERVGQGGKKVRKALFSELSTYWARHTWATVAADLDVPDETISLALGHAGANSTTNIYINRNQRKVDEANRKVIDYINSVLSE